MVKCKNNVRQIGLGLAMYVTDEMKYPRLFENSAVSTFNVRWWFQSLEPYAGAAWTNALYHCPAMKFSENFTTNGNGVQAQGSYGYNADGTERYSGITENLGLGKATSMPTQPSISESAVLVPVDMIAISDGPAGGFVGIGLIEPTTNTAAHANATSFDWRASWHKAGENVVFCDGHTEQIKRAGLFDPTIAARRWNNDHEAHQETWW